VDQSGNHVRGIDAWGHCDMTKPACSGQGMKCLDHFSFTSGLHYPIVLHLIAITYHISFPSANEWTDQFDFYRLCMSLTKIAKKKAKGEPK